jgi:hypothetical protein
VRRRAARYPPIADDMTATILPAEIRLFPSLLLPSDRAACEGCAPCFRTGCPICTVVRPDFHQDVIIEVAVGVETGTTATAKSYAGRMQCAFGAVV